MQRIVIVANPGYLHDNSRQELKCVSLREGFIKKKKKKSRNFPTFGFAPPPVKSRNFFFFFIGFPNVLAHLEHIWKKMIFPLEKLKILRIFPQIWSSDPP